MSEEECAVEAIIWENCLVSVMSPGCLIKNWAKYVLPLLRSALCGQRETVKPQRETQALSLSVAAIPLLMTYSFTSLHCLENNEGVCCINLCNGEQEEG